MARARLGIPLVVTSLAAGACGSDGGAPPSSGAGGSVAPGSSGATAAASSSSTSGAGSSSGAGGAAGVTPIALADAWVAGWYGTSFRGTNLYAHVDTPGDPSGYYTVWRGDPGVTDFANVTDCSSFSDVLMRRAYGWQPPTTSPRPLAADYYWAIRGGVGFTTLAAVSDLRVGDTLALLYGTSDAGGDTGHVAWIDALPAPYSDAPTEAGLTQWAVTVVDSADGFHFAPAANAANQDDRYLGPLTGGAHCSTNAQCVAQYGPSAVCDTTSLANDEVCAYTGIGRGQLRLYADASGNIAGYTWGTSSGSVFYPRPAPLPDKGGSFTGRDVVAGRFTPP
jgi:hypothetical protein